MDACGRLEISFLLWRFYRKAKVRGSTKRGGEEWAENLIELHAYRKLGKFRKQMFSSNLSESAEEWKGECPLQAHNQNFARIWTFFASSYCRCRFPCLCTSSVYHVVSFRNVPPNEVLAKRSRVSRHWEHWEHCGTLQNIASGRRRTHGVAFAANVWRNETEILSAIRDYIYNYVIQGI